MILIVAPYSPINTETPHLGAARKLESVILALSKFDREIIIINSAHNKTQRCELEVKKIYIGDLVVTEIVPETYNSRPFGKVMNLLLIGNIISFIKKNYMSPKLVWFYNGYSFEMLFAVKYKKHDGCKYIMEFEDWHFSRSRGFSLKPYLDYFFWRLSINLFDAAFCVNKKLLNIFSQKNRERIPVYELPGFVDDGVVNMAKKFTPFQNSDFITVGYFGGLSKEKGSALLLETIKISESNVKFIIVGSGEFYADFDNFRQLVGDKIELYSNIEFSDLCKLIARSDIVLNPHHVSQEYLCGLFPSKILEAVGSGRYVISTKLPDITYSEVLNGIKFVEEDPGSVNKAINSARTDFLARNLDILNSSQLAAHEFGVSSFGLKINHILK